MDSSKEQEIRNWDLSPLQESIVELALSKQNDDYQERLPVVVRKITDAFPNDDPDGKAEDFLWNFWGFFIRLGQSLPKSQNDHLVGLVMSLRAEEKGNITIWGVCSSNPRENNRGVNLVCSPNLLFGMISRF